MGAGSHETDHRPDGHRRQGQRLHVAELPAVVHRRAARGRREDGPPPQRHSYIGGEESSDGRGVSRAHRESALTPPATSSESRKLIAGSWKLVARSLAYAAGTVRDIAIRNDDSHITASTSVKSRHKRAIATL